MNTSYSWQGILTMLMLQPEGTIARIPATEITHPSGAGLVATLGFPLGQSASFSAPLDDGRALWVNDFGSHYEAQLLPHQSTFAPAHVPASGGAAIEDFLRESPGTSFLAATALGALFGALTRTKEGTMAGALMGGVVGLSAVSVAASRPGHERSERAKELAELLARFQATHAPSPQMEPKPTGSAAVPTELPPRTPRVSGRSTPQAELSAKPRRKAKPSGSTTGGAATQQRRGPKSK